MGRADLHIERRAEDADGVTLALSGAITEHADLGPLRDRDTGTLVLELGGVERINSVGVGKWIRAMKAIPTTVAVTWRAVSPALVTQLSMIANFHGHSRIESFYAPYFCEAPTCGWEGRVLMTSAALMQRAESPEHTCPECGASAVLDDLEEDYFGAIRATATV